MKSGIVNVYKESGYTSFDVVARLRGILKIKKIGHTGTLDPAAQGVLPVCIGKATRLCGLLTDRDKVYVAKMRLGIVTDTQDMTGKVLREQQVSVTPEEVKKVIASFVGEQQQLPPMYSAIKVDGRRLCDLAREGIEVERKKRPITIYDIRLRSLKLPEVEMEVFCSKGTYIRTLCHDIGEALGCGACMASLLRTRAAGFVLEDALTLEQIERLAEAGQLEDKMTSVDEALKDYPAVTAGREMTRLLSNGNAVPLEGLSGDVEKCTKSQLVRMYLWDGRFVGLFKKCHDFFKPVKMFLE